jgi:hypothetical protein
VLYWTGAEQTAEIATGHTALADPGKSETIVRAARRLADPMFQPIVPAVEKGKRASSGERSMSRTKQTSRRTHRSKAVPVLGAAGLSLTLASGASFANPTPALDSVTRDAAANCEIVLREEEVFDQSLATFHVFDNESAGPRRAGERLMTFGGGGCCQFACLAGQSSAGSESPPTLGADAYSRPSRPVRPTYKHVRRRPES